MGLVDSTVYQQPPNITTLLKSADNPPSPYNVPSISDWREMWKAWDLITLEMIPSSMLHEKPIDLRHKCLFYLGHIPAWAIFFHI
jgi:hypothetical protein